MIRQAIITVVILIAAGLIASRMLSDPPQALTLRDEHGQMIGGEEPSRGPNGGRLLEDGDFALEVTIFERGIPPEFRLFAYQAGQVVAPEAVEAEVELLRLGDQTNSFSFQAEGDYLRGDGEVVEPHSFEVMVSARHQGKTYQWSYENLEGRTQISPSMALEAGLDTEIAGPATIHETLSLTGRVQTDPNRLSRVRPRFPGVVEKVNVQLGDEVSAGQVLATIQSNESLQSYAVRAPIAGLLVLRDIQVGESTGEKILFIIEDLSRVWIELDVFASDLSRVGVGQAAVIDTFDGSRLQGEIDWVSPLAAHASQSVTARVPLDNPDGRLRPGQFVRGLVTIAKYEVALAVRQSALQRFRDFQVVFSRFEDVYEVRMLELGRKDDVWVEVLGGLEPGTEYVVSNSYLVKADIEKSGASHDH